MIETWHYFKCMRAAKHHKLENEYAWYKYLMMWKINSFFSRFKLKSKDSLPF